MKKGISIYKCGTYVHIPAGDITGWISAISISFDNISYEISYFAGTGEHMTIWLHDTQFTTQNNRTKIGFKN